MRLAGDCIFYTALGDDERGAWSRRRLADLGVRVEAATRDEPTRRGVVFVDANGERTITTLGRRLEPTTTDDLPWNELEDVDAVYFTAGDVAALREARRAGRLVATSRVFELTTESELHLDAVVGSGNDPAEAFDPERLTHPGSRGPNRWGSRRPVRDSRGPVGAYEQVAPPGLSLTPAARATRSRRDSRSPGAWRGDGRAVGPGARGAVWGMVRGERGRSGTSSPPIRPRSLGRARHLQPVLLAEATIVAGPSGRSPSRSGPA